MTLITTVSDDQSEILWNIQRLHNNNQPFQADLTWGSGGFWRNRWRTPPMIRMDLAPAPESLVNIQADIRALPFKPGSLKSAVVDLPFIHAPGKASVMGQRFSGYPSQKALNVLHWEAAHQIALAMQPGGLVVWKCQDIIESSKQVWNHIKIHMHATAAGLHAEDLFILHRFRTAVVGWNHTKQQHARRTHSYFWVLRKRS